MNGRNHAFVRSGLGSSRLYSGNSGGLGCSADLHLLLGHMKDEEIAQFIVCGCSLDQKQYSPTA